MGSFRRNRWRRRAVVLVPALSASLVLSTFGLAAAVTHVPTPSGSPGESTSASPTATPEASPSPTVSAVTPVQTAEAEVVPPVDNTPTCQPLSLRATMNVAVNGQLNCSNPQAEALTYALELRPSSGVVTGLTSTGAFVYDPNMDFIGDDVFSIRVTAPGGKAVVVTIPVEVKALPPSCPADFRAKSEATFNNPNGNHDAQFAIQDQILRLTDCTQPFNPDGSRASITASFYSLSYPPVRNALAEAAERGVSVKVLMNSHADTWAEWQVLAGQLGTDIKARSFAYTCPNGCLRARTPPPEGHPRSVFRVQPQSQSGRTFTFVDISRPGTAPIVAWAWNFGDGTTAKGAGPFTHTYKKNGSYLAKLTVLSADGKTHQANNRVFVPDSTEALYPGLHSKLFLFSNVGVGANRVTNVFLHSSANPTYRQSVVGYNNAYTSVGDPVMFNTLAGYHADLLKGATGEIMTPSYYRSVPSSGTASSPEQRVNFYPRPQPAGVSSLDSDNIRQMLRQVQCKYTQDGVAKRTYVTVSMAIITRRGVGEDLWRMAYDKPFKWGGCYVEVLYGSMSQRVKDSSGRYTSSSWGVADCLSTNPVTSSGRYNNLDNSSYGRCGGGTLRGYSPQSLGNAGFWWNKTSSLSGGRLKVGVSCPVAAKTDRYGRKIVRCIESPTYTHNKVIMINGMYAGKVQKVVITGSPNLTTGALRANDEIGFRIHSAAAYDQYRSDYAKLTAQALANSTNSVLVNGRRVFPDVYEAERDPVTGRLLPQIAPGVPLDVLADAG